MGCDIHIQAEVLGPDGVWRWLEPTWENTPWRGDSWGETLRESSQQWGVPPTWYYGRNYGLFARLAGVRDGSAAIFPARGWPDDLDSDTRCALWDGEAEDLSGLHHHSWLTWEEGCAEGLRDCEGWGRLMAAVLLAAVHALGGPVQRDGLRLVFAFDN